MNTPRHADPRIAAIVQAYEALSPQGLAQLAEIYTEDARFKDPFNEVQGVPAITAIFEHMFRTLDAPRFRVHEAVVQGRQCFLTWDFVFGLKGRAQPPLVVRGASHLRLAEDGRIELHRDYWDVAEELYEKLPVLGALMRWLKRRVNS
ncbi:nuclear transport factor 2 family protein [Rubrivivax rivuli]|uniref:Nuclear transport factor 2 family protein n=1 Tax=Rubrivivax rivuli TaxID=1862385 RepID=A0A437RQL6_9BURK|nr:nuclear transport factor 2 family protein [Rubrivivax rivuli]RVU49090.1 nuclear transport factor 2 family protein [Rubrivivax rivuli]